MSAADAVNPQASTNGTASTSMAGSSTTGAANAGSPDSDSTAGGSSNAGSSNAGSPGSDSSSPGSSSPGSASSGVDAEQGDDPANDASGAIPGSGAQPSEAANPGAPSGCTVTIESAEISEAIATVGIVTFSASVEAIASARIEFGLDTSYGMTAPVDLTEPGYRTLLLGMKQDRQYHYRIVVATPSGEECSSDDQTIETGFLPNILPELDVNDIAPERLQGGFISTGQYQARGGSSSPAYIIDADGDYVWAIAIGDYVTGVRQSYDGKYMWINGTDNTTGGRANIHRVSMDGLVDEDMSEVFGQQDHSITVLPEETVVFYGHDQTECANIRQRFADGTILPIVNSGDAHMAPGACHVNAIEYSPMDDTLIFSDDNHNNYTKIRRDGAVVWVLGGETSHFTGDASQWIREHGVDALAEDRILIFNNNEPQDPRGSVATEILLDLQAMTATKVWEYQADPPISNQVLGDVQRMENGNTVIAYSAQGVLHEVDAEGNLLQEIIWPLGGAFGYIVKRQTLYGPPPR